MRERPNLSFAVLAARKRNIAGCAWSSMHRGYASHARSRARSVVTRHRHRMPLQDLRRPRCDTLVASVAASAASALRRTQPPPTLPPDRSWFAVNWTLLWPSWQPAVPADADGVAASTRFSAIWAHTPLPDDCHLYARKFAPDVRAHRHSFFEACDMLGLDTACLFEAQAAAAHGLSGRQSHG